MRPPIKKVKASLYNQFFLDELIFLLPYIKSKPALFNSFIGRLQKIKKNIKIYMLSCNSCLSKNERVIGECDD